MKTLKCGRTGDTFDLHPSFPNLHFQTASDKTCAGSGAGLSTPHLSRDEMRWPSARLCIVFLLVSDNRSYKIQSHLLANDNQQLLHKQGSFCGATGWPLSDHSLREMPFVAGQARSTFHWFSKAQHTWAQPAPKSKIGSNPSTASARDACLGKCQKLARGNYNCVNELLLQQVDLDKGKFKEIQGRGVQGSSEKFREVQGREV